MSFTRDILYGLRQIRRSPWQPLVIVLSLGFALGINTSLFSLVNAIWFAPWSVDDPDRMRVVGPAVSSDEWRYWSAQTTSFSGLAAQRGGPMMRLGGRMTPVTLVSANYFHVLGTTMQAGRGLAARDDGTDVAANSAVISHHLWQTRLRGDANVIGRVITLDPSGPQRASVSLTVVGVAAPGFEGPDRIRRQLWMPLAAARLFQPAGRNQDDDSASAQRVMAFGRLAPGTSDAQARAELEALSRRFRSDPSLPHTPIVVRSTDSFSQSPPPLQTRAMMGSLLIGVAFITLIACSNVSNLLLARGHARRGDIAVRLALGAGRGRIVRQLLTESLMLTLVAAWLGVMIALWLPEAAFRSLFQSASSDLGEMIRLTVSFDRRVFVWGLAMSLIACVAFGLAPALRCTEFQLGDVLKDAHGTSRTALMSSLIGYQTIVSVMALVIAGLILRSGPVAEAGPIGRAVVASPSVATAYMAMAFGMAALLLGMVGFFSVLEYAVRQRTREIGIRRALGAQPWDVVRALFAPAARPLIRGLLMGSVGAACAGAFMQQADMPAGLNPLDPLTYGAVAAVLVIAGVLASYVPARRAIRIAPSEALRLG